MNSFPGGWELKMVGGGPNRFEDLEWAIAFFSELLHGSKGSNVGTFEPYFRTNFKRGKVVPFGIVIRFHDTSGFSEGGNGMVPSVIQLGHLIRSGWVVQRKRSLLPLGV